MDAEEARAVALMDRIAPILDGVTSMCLFDGRPCFNFRDGDHRYAMTPRLLARYIADRVLEDGYEDRAREATCGTCGKTTDVSMALVFDEHTWSHEDGPGSENPPETCPCSGVAVER